MSYYWSRAIKSPPIRSFKIKRWLLNMFNVCWGCYWEPTVAFYLFVDKSFHKPLYSSVCWVSRQRRRGWCRLGVGTHNFKGAT